jgi:hypothetical protein
MVHSMASTLALLLVRFRKVTTFATPNEFPRLVFSGHLFVFQSLLNLHSLSLLFGNLEKSDEFAVVAFVLDDFVFVKPLFG